MCGQKKEICQKPENLKGEPTECTPEQIEQCHGGVKDHPCINANEGAQDANDG
jgi:hypothetical protein